MGFRNNVLPFADDRHHVAEASHAVEGRAGRLDGSLSADEVVILQGKTDGRALPGHFPFRIAVRSRPRAHLFRIVVGEAHDARRQALLLAVQLADLHRRADLAGAAHRPARARCSCPGSASAWSSSPRPPGRGRCARSRRGPRPRSQSISSPTSLRRGCSLRRISASRPMKSSVLVFSGTVKPMPASNGSVSSRELVVREDQPRLDPHHVQRLQPHRLQPMLLARLPDRVEDRHGILRVAEDLVAEFAGVAGARHHHRRALEMADAAHGKAEPPKLVDRRLRRRGPDDLLQDFAAVRPLHGNVVQLVRR